MLKPYSVLVARPGYITDDSSDTFYIFNFANDPDAAAFKARKEARVFDAFEDCRWWDYSVLLVIAGHHPAF